MAYLILHEDWRMTNRWVLVTSCEQLFFGCNSERSYGDYAVCIRTWDHEGVHLGITDLNIPVSWW